MPAADIPDDVRRLIATSIRSATELEAVLFLRQNASQAWTAPALASAVYIGRDAADHLLFDLMARGFLILIHQTPPTYRYRPKTPEFGRAIERLAELYPNHRLTIVSLIGSRPSESLRLFSDAFRLWKRDGRQED